jgi:aldehyde:ferredoxin oxidoreductase
MLGFTGSLLRFDLTKNLATTETISHEFLKEWIGGNWVRC